MKQTINVQEKGQRAFKALFSVNTYLAKSPVAYSRRANAKFDNSVPEKTDLRAAFNYIIDPDIN
jgi:hypothetical protein